MGSIAWDELISAGRGLDAGGLASFLDAGILFFGAYEQPATLVAEHFDEIVEPGRYDLMIYAGHVLCSVDASVAIDLFDAASRCGKTLSERYAAQHRAAAVEIKRLKKPESGLERLRWAKQNYVDRSLEGSLDSALSANLEALASLQVDGGTEAYDLLSLATERTAASLHDDEDLSSRDSRSRAGRHRSQVAINEAQLHVFDGEPDDAVRRLEQNLSDAFDRAFECLSGAQGELAYARLLAGDYGGATAGGVEAFWRAESIGAIGSVRVARKIIITSLVRLDRIDAAESLAELMERDVPGVYGLVPGVYGW